MRPIRELIEQRRRQVLVHGCLYYRFDTNIVDDHTYDRWSQELAELQEKNPDDAAEASFHEYFVDFDGSTGFDLPTHLPEVTSKAHQLLEYRKRLKQKGDE